VPQQRDDVRRREEHGRTALHAAAARGDLSEVCGLIASGADLGAADTDGFTPLHLAAGQFHVDVAAALLEAGADVNRQNRFGNSPLSIAVFNSRGRGEMIGLLRSCGADPFAANTSGQTPIGLSRLIANYDVAQFFADVRPESPQDTLF
jgi:ankyrin repeat protein